jgi:hypothetical protein
LQVSWNGHEIKRQQVSPGLWRARVAVEDLYNLLVVIGVGHSEHAAIADLISILYRMVKQDMLLAKMLGASALEG